MDVGYAALKQRSSAVADAIATERSARNMASRRKAVERADERAKTRDQLDKKRRDDREAEAAGRRRIRVKVERRDRPKYRGSTPRRLYHRQIDRMLAGTTGLTDSRGPDGLYSMHYAFTARGFASRKVRRWRSGEAERAALYGVREAALEGGEHGWWSNIANDRNELAAHYRASEALEKHDRANANVYCTEVIALPAELTARQRRRAVRRICRWLEARGLAYTVGIHMPDEAGDQRNYHCHIIYSLRPCQRVAPYEWSFAPGKENDINTPAGIRARRLAVVRAINVTLHAAKIDKRYTHLSNKARNMAPSTEGKDGQNVTWARRRLAAMELRRERLRALSGILADVRGAVVDGVAKLDAAYQLTDWGLDDRVRAVRWVASGSGLDTMRARIVQRLDQVRQVVGGNVDAVPIQDARRRARNWLADMRDEIAADQQRSSIDLAAAQTLDRLGQIEAFINDRATPGAVRIDTAAGNARDRLIGIRTSATDLIAVGTKRVAAMARRIERTEARNDISVTIMEVTTKGALALSEVGSVLRSRLATMMAGLRTATSSGVDTARTDVSQRLADIQLAIGQQSPAMQRSASRLYAAKPRGKNAKPDSAAMAAIRAYTPSPKPFRDEGVERTPAVTALAASQSKEATMKQKAETLSTSGDRTLARIMAIERERVDRELAWKRLLKSRAVVSHDGERYVVEMTALTEVEARLLSRAGFVDELQRRLEVLFARQSEISPPDAHQVAEDDADLAMQQALQRGQQERE